MRVRATEKERDREVKETYGKIESEIVTEEIK